MTTRRTALIAGVFYLLTFVSIPTLSLYGPAHETGYIAGSGSGNGVVAGAVLEVIVAFACIGTAVTLFPVLKQWGEARALGFVAVRVLEAAGIFVGVAALLTVVSLRRAGVGDAGLVTGQALADLYDWVFLISQGLIPAVNAVLLGTLLLQSRLVPRILPVVGLAGAPLLVLSDLGVLFDLWDRQSAVAAVAALPIALWEFSLGVYLVARGFRETTTPLTVSTVRS